MGSYTYPASGAGALRPHALSAITGTVNAITNPSFSYDDNGNLLDGLGRRYAWSAANLPTLIDRLSGTDPLERTEFAYGPDRQRLLQRVRPMRDGLPGSTSRLTRYAGSIDKEIDYAANLTTVRTYLPNRLGYFEQIHNSSSNLPGEPIASSQYRFFHSDAHGSLLAVSSPSGSLLQRFAYDAWGRRRKLNGSDDSWTTLGSSNLWNPFGHFGYTGHEHIDQLGLIHMGARVYDPIVARMTSADPTVPDAKDVQAFNRYSYVLNNALKYVDPTGLAPVREEKVYAGPKDEGTPASTQTVTIVG
ncbi:MAG: RHS repeat-associated core domain-containing protein, partial [Burkholderiales bacterium]|nr:RHS repeat-associated core domain-containing protein [Burkholderiales bacterium]